MPSGAAAATGEARSISRGQRADRSAVASAQEETKTRASRSGTSAAARSTRIVKFLRDRSRWSRPEGQPSWRLRIRQSRECSLPSLCRGFRRHRAHRFEPTAQRSRAARGGRAREESSARRTRSRRGAGEGGITRATTRHLRVELKREKFDALTKVVHSGGPSRPQRSLRSAETIEGDRRRDPRRRYDAHHAVQSRWTLSSATSSKRINPGRVRGDRRGTARERDRCGNAPTLVEILPMRWVGASHADASSRSQSGTRAVPSRTAHARRRCARQRYVPLFQASPRCVQNADLWTR